MFCRPGAAHGLSGILYSLLNFPAFVKSDPSIEGEIKATVDYFLTIQNEDGNFAHDVQEVGFSRPGGDLVHWCHGAPGESLMICFINFCIYVY